MKVLILAGGSGKRLYPVTEGGSKLYPSSCDRQRLQTISTKVICYCLVISPPCFFMASPWLLKARE
jgi:hypothetical protein